MEKTYLEDDERVKTDHELTRLRKHLLHTMAMRRLLIGEEGNTKAKAH